MPDAHIPYLDPGAFQTALAFLRFYKPHIVVQLGDLVDFYSLSRFCKDPARLTDLQEELDEARLILGKIRDAAPEAVFYFLRGNHEMRLTKHLWTKAPEFSKLRSLQLDSLLGLKERKIEYVESGVMQLHGFIIKHGNLVRSRSGYTATGELEKSGTSGVSGHSHRAAQVYKRNVSGMFSWTEAGCLCDLNPEYAEGQVLDWIHSIAYGTFEKEGNRFEIHLAPIVKNKIVIAGREIIP